MAWPGLRRREGVRGNLRHHAERESPLDAYVLGPDGVGMSADAAG